MYVCMNVCVCMDRWMYVCMYKWILGWMDE
jgi:hypothetical protein